jgi:transcriptional regulator with XRE-family HTH domain
MAASDFPANLRLLCGYGKSVADICRRAGINRQQFNRYLAGQAQPSLRSLRQICDFFGLEDHEILLDQDSFTRLIRQRPLRLIAAQNPFFQTMSRFFRYGPDSEAILERHGGYYFGYFRPDPLRPEILCTLSHIYRRDGVWLVHTVERHERSDYMAPTGNGYRGFVLEAADRLVICERQQGAGQVAWMSMLFSAEHGKPTFLPGLVMGITEESAHEIQCYRGVWEYLGTTIDVRAAIRKCGALADDDPRVTPYIRFCTSNEISPGERTFGPRY